MSEGWIDDQLVARGIRDARVLDVGTGSGYQAAILAELAREVVTIERRPELADAARERLGRLGYFNVCVVVGDGSIGREEGGPYDAILVAAASPRVPESLKRQLADGGRLVIPVGSPVEQFLIVDVDAEVVEPLRGISRWHSSLVNQVRRMKSRASPPEVRLQIAAQERR